jgi:hypothetical protein
MGCKEGAIQVIIKGYIQNPRKQKPKQPQKTKKKVGENYFVFFLVLMFN